MRTVLKEIASALEFCYEVGCTKEELIHFMKRKSYKPIVIERTALMVNDLLYDNVKNFKDYAAQFGVTIPVIESDFSFIYRKFLWYIRYMEKNGEKFKKNTENI